MDFSERLENYFFDVNKVHTEASKAYLFLNFIRDVFSGIDARYSYQLFPYLEKYLKNKEGTVSIKGRADALLGNLIIEFKDELTKGKLQTAKEELRRYISIVWSNEKERPKYLLIATDGVSIRVYRPRFVQMKLFETMDEIDITPDRISLEPLGQIRLDKVDENYAYIWLDRYLLYRELQAPTTENFLNTFGKATPVYQQSIGILKDKWSEVESQPHVRVLYDEWEKYLEIVYGSRIGEVDLFLRHTYVATLSKLMATIFYSDGALPSPDEIVKTLNGEAFGEWGIQNFLETDFFSWILRIDTDFVVDFSRHLIDHLRSFDLTQLSEDILKGLYQALVDPEERHDLGEYYTPDWLAESIVRDLIDDPQKSVLDPACGSGTFLASVIRMKKKAFKESGKNETEILEAVLTQVFGVDIHPLAVITSKVNYLLALGELIQHKRKSIIIPVFLADSIKLPTFERLLEGVDVYKFRTNGEELVVPSSVVKYSHIADEIFNYVKAVVEGDSLPDDLETNLKKHFNKFGLDAEDYAVIAALIGKLKEFKDKGKDSIWTYILKNIYKPIFLSEKKFDYLIGNPPWISYRYMSSDYQEFVKDQIVNRYKLLPSKKVELMTHMEFGALFFARAADLYLKKNGKIGFVMPRGIFTADQHDNFRTGAFNPLIKLEKVFDLDKVKPLFNISSCVVFGKKGKKTKYPINGKEFSGTLKSKNASLREAAEALTIVEKKLYLNKIGTRSFIFDRKIEVPPSGGYYKKLFSQGATLVPRNFWFVEIQKHPRLGINPQKPYVKTSEAIIKYAKPPYRDIIFEGNIEREYLYATLRGSEVVPFSHLPFLMVLLPLRKNKNRYEILHKEDVKLSDPGLHRWLSKAESEWDRLRGEKAERVSAVEWLNYRNKITNQTTSKRFKVLYLTSGTHLASCLVNLETELKTSIDDTEIQMNGYVADTKTYYYETGNKEEAQYLVAVLNSEIVDELIKGMQSRGLWGPRDIHKKVLELPIPKFNHKNPVHRELSEIAKICKAKADEILPSLTEKYNSIGYIRKKIKDELKDETDRLSELVLTMLSEQSPKGILDY